MIKGNAWVKWPIYDENDALVWHDIKVAYEYESGWFEDGVYNDRHERIEVLQYPEYATDELKQQIDQELPEILEDLLDNSDESERDFDDYYESKREQSINDYIDNLNQ